MKQTRIRSCLKDAGISMAEIARHLGVSRQYVHQLVARDPMAEASERTIVQALFAMKPHWVPHPALRGWVFSLAANDQQKAE